MKDVKIILDWVFDDLRSMINMITERICSLPSMDLKRCIP